MKKIKLKKIIFITLLTFVVIFTLINFDSSYNQRNYFVLSKERIPTITKIKEDNENYYYLVNDEKCKHKGLNVNYEENSKFVTIEDRNFSENMYIYNMTIKKNSNPKLSFACYDTLSIFPMFRYHFKI
jgi:hypothetical protein